MWNLSKGDQFLPQTSLSDLQRFYRKEPHAKAKMRLLAALHRKQGRSLDQIAELLHKPRRTVHCWLQRFQQRGPLAKDAIAQPGRPPKLSLPQRRALLRQLELGPSRQRHGLWSSRQVRELIHQRYRVSYRPGHVWKILRDLGFSLQRPRPRHRRSASAAEVERFKKKPVAWPEAIGGGGLWWAQKTKPPLG